LHNLLLAASGHYVGAAYCCRLISVVCLSVCRSVCLSQSWALQKQLNRSRCRLECRLGWTWGTMC